MAQKTSYGIDCKGKFISQRIANLPPWASADQARIVYDDSGDKLYYGNDTTWVSGSGAVTGSFLDRVGWYPNVITSTGKLAVTQGSGAVVVSAGQTFFMRATALSTDNFLLAARTLTTLASKTYHLRYAHQVAAGYDNFSAAHYTARGVTITDGVGMFYIVDVANTTYNPSSLAETDSSFDSKYDDMLVAKIVTNSSNIATITSLVNRDCLIQSESLFGDYRFSDRQWHVFDPASAITFNWARTPIVDSGLTLLRNMPLTSSLTVNHGNPESTPAALWGHKVCVNCSPESVGSKIVGMTRYGMQMHCQYENYQIGILFECHIGVFYLAQI